MCCFEIILRYKMTIFEIVLKFIEIRNLNVVLNMKTIYNFNVVLNF
jgi:hypothetical protein